MGSTYIHRFEPGEGERVLLLLHGTGGTEADLLGMGRELEPEAALLSPRGKVLENGMPRFFRRHAEGVFDEADVIQRAGELGDFVEWSRAEYGLGDRPVVAVGYSNGANIASAIMLERPGVLAGGILLRPMVPLVPKITPDLGGTRVLLAGGRFDPLAPEAEVERLATLLGGMGAAVTVRWADAGHELRSEDFAGAAAWLRAESFTSASERRHGGDSDLR